MRIFILCGLLLAGCFARAQQPAWRNFDPAVFAAARVHHKLVLLDLKANWCHWCHVMDDSTYSNPAVQRYLQAHFIVAQADQDNRPDLATRYKDYGWPATILFTADGSEIDKQAGYFAPDEMLSILKYAVAHPNGVTTTSKLKPAAGKNVVAKSLENKFYNTLNFDNGGFDFEQKYLDVDTYEYALHQRHADTALSHWLHISTRNAATSLQDTVWGGVYQYSTYSDWQHQHFEKLGNVQARYIKMFCWYAQTFHAPWALDAARLTARYCNTFLNAHDSAFYNAQDADAVPGEKATAYFQLDDAARRQQGIPAVDTHIYTNVNAELAEAFLVLWGATGDNNYRQKALLVLDFMLQHHRQQDGSGFVHEHAGEDLVTLSDNLNTARALFYAYRATNDNNYLQVSKDVGDFIVKTFSNANGGFNSYAGNNGLKPQPVLSENIDACRFLNLLSYATDDKELRARAAKTLQYLLTPVVQQEVSTEPGILSALGEVGKEPLSATLLFYGQTGDTERMLQQTLASPVFYLVNHTYADPTALPEDKRTMFEGFNKPVLFFCTARFCSAPLFDSEGVQDYFAK